MGVSVYSVSATSPEGSSFHRNWWWWRPLWEYTQSVAGDLVANVNGDYNNGEGLDLEGSEKLAQVLFAHYASGHAKTWHEERLARLATLPKETCHVCDGNGVTLKTLPKKELSECSICKGEGMVANSQNNYSFDPEDVREFAEFLKACGGFRIC